MQLVIAEKPSVARDLARVLGVPARGKTYFEGEGRVITWCVGHLVELEEPASYDGRWKAWRMDTLPMIPVHFELRPVKQTASQLRAVRDLLRDRRFREVVNACDAGREGELIFRYVYQIAGSRLPIRRLWISSLTDEAIRQGFAALRSGVQFDALGDAARCRSEADWLVGMNATRALTLRQRAAGDDQLWSIGRVQTPTLAILVRREREIRAFVPRDYWEVRGRFARPGEAGQAGQAGSFAATWYFGKATRFAVEPPAQSIVERSTQHGAARDPIGPVVEKLRKKTVREPPPLLFDLTSLQRTANKRFGLSAARTLEIAQALYETHKVLTYPRTDSRHLSSDMVPTMPALFRALSVIPDYAPHVAPLVANPLKPTKRVFDDSKVSDHHAIIPTGKPIHLEKLSFDEKRVLDLVVRRFVGVFHPDAEFALTEVWVRVGQPGGEGAAAKSSTESASGEEVPMLSEAPPPPDRFFARGRVRVVAGWQAVAGFGDEERESKSGGRSGDGEEREGEEEAQQTLPPLVEGERLEGAFETLKKRTRPPSRFTEAGLLSAMESAGKQIDDEELRQAMKERGLGTPATRAATIETLLKRSYIARAKKLLVPTPTGIELIEALPVESLASPELTGTWEQRLSRIARGEERRDAFMAGIVGYVNEIVAAMKGTAAPTRVRVVEPELVPVGVDLGDEVEVEAATVERAGEREKSRRGGRGEKAKRSGTKAAAKTRAVKSAKVTAAKEESASEEAFDVGVLVCPKCKLGRLLTGHRGWGCSRWKEGCRFVIWFEMAGRPVTPTQLKELVLRGRTRRGKFRPSGAWTMGRLVLDLERREGASARFAEE